MHNCCNTAGLAASQILRAPSYWWTPAAGADRQVQALCDSPTGAGWLPPGLIRTAWEVVPKEPLAGLSGRFDPRLASAEQLVELAFIAQVRDPRRHAE